MHDLFEIKSASGTHKVRTTDQSLRDTVAASGASLILADSVFREMLEGIDQPVLFIEAVETSKDLARMPALIEACREYGLVRDGHVLAVGGGVVQDIACFVASTYMRGVCWTYLPTTLLAMVDSCIGGKSSINVGAHKNLVGTFYPPDGVVIVLHTLATLPVEHIAAGRAEAAKICFARGEDAFDRYLALDGGEAGRHVGELVELSLASKKWFIEIDEFDRAERLLLNFGHSFGHAIESCVGYAVPHGVGVGVGCLAAVSVSCALTPSLQRNSRVERLRTQMLDILQPVSALGERLAEVERGDFFRYWDGDKKHSSEAYRPILLNEEANLHRPSLPRTKASANLIWQGFCAAKDAVLS